MLSAQQAEGTTELLGVHLLSSRKTLDHLVDVKAVELLFLSFEHIQEVDVCGEHVRRLVEYFDGHVLHSRERGITEQMEQTQVLTIIAVPTS